MIQVLTNMPSNAIPFSEIIGFYDLDTCPYFLGNFNRGKALTSELEYLQSGDLSDTKLLEEAL